MARQQRSSSHLICPHQETLFREDSREADLSSEYIQFKIKQLENLNLKCSENVLFKKHKTGSTTINRHLRKGSDNAPIQYMIQKYSAYHQSRNTPLELRPSDNMKIEVNELKKIHCIDHSVYDKNYEEAWGLKPGKHIAYRYQIIKLLGEGAFAQVYECVDHKVNERVALKVLK